MCWSGCENGTVERRFLLSAWFLHGVSLPLGQHGRTLPLMPDRDNFGHVHRYDIRSYSRRLTKWSLFSTALQSPWSNRNEKAALVPVPASAEIVSDFRLGQRKQAVPCEFDSSGNMTPRATTMVATNTGMSWLQTGRARAFNVTGLRQVGLGQRQN